MFEKNICLIFFRHSICDDYDIDHAKGDLCIIKESISTDPNYHEETKIEMKKQDVYDVKEIYDPSDIRNMFFEAIEDFYNISENGGPR